MTFREFLANRIEKITIYFICAAVTTFFLSVTGTQTGVLLILLLTLTPIFGAIQLSDFFRQRNRVQELETVLEKLDQKYLFTECVSPPRDLYERRLFNLTRRAGRAMTGAVSDARAAQREYREYVESWVHEIKAPITAAELICQNTDSETRRKLTRELSQIETHVERALFYARAESPEKDFIIRKLTLSDLAAQAVSQHRALLLENNIQVETENLEQTVYTDSKWAVFILGQLLQNAARYRGKEPVITLSAKRLGTRLQLAVKDNGIGIPPHELPRVFDRGFTGSNGRARGGSTGMGLYLCKKLADSLRLEFCLKSEEGGGTEVTVIFPARDNL